MHHGEDIFAALMSLSCSAPQAEQVQQRIERFLAVEMSATGTSLGSWFPAGDHYDLTAIATRFVLQESPEHPPSGVGDIFGETTVPGQSCHIQILKYNRLVFADVLGTEFVQEIQPLMSYLLLGSRYQKTGLLSVTGTLRLSAQIPL